MQSETFSCCSRRKHKSLRLFKKAICFLLFICLSLILIYNFQLIPTLIPFVRAHATTLITLEMQKIIGECVATGDYSDFTTLEYGADNTVVSLKTNAASIAKLSSSIAETAILKLSENDRLCVSIPAGNLTGGAIFTGKGPDIDISLAVSKKITCHFENEFYERGINQTLHRIVAKVETEVYALVPMSHQSITVVTEYCIAETVIVGKVPEAYTKINRLDEEIEESDIDDIYDFGAVLD